MDKRQVCWALPQERNTRRKKKSMSQNRAQHCWEKQNNLKTSPRHIIRFPKQKRNYQLRGCSVWASPLLSLQLITMLLGLSVKVKFWFPCLCLQVSSCRLLIYLEKKDPRSHWSEAFSKFHQRISLWWASTEAWKEQGLRVTWPGSRHGRATGDFE